MVRQMGAVRLMGTTEQQRILTDGQDLVEIAGRTDDSSSRHCCSQ
jgi:hypothetical protein